MTTNQQNPATVSQLSTIEGDRQKCYYPPQALAENSNIMAYAREKGFASVDELYAWTIAHPQEFWAEMANRFLDWYQPAYSTPKLPLIPRQSCHRFQVQAATDSTGSLPPSDGVLEPTATLT